MHAPTHKHTYIHARGHTVRAHTHAHARKGHTLSQSIRIYCNNSDLIYINICCLDVTMIVYKFGFLITLLHLWTTFAFLLHICQSYFMIFFDFKTFIDLHFFCLHKSKLLVSQRDNSVHVVCLSVCGSVRNPDLAPHTTVLIRLFWSFTYIILGQRSRS